MSCAPRRVETPSPDGPADFETFWTRTDRPVRVPRNFSLSVVLLPDRGNTQHGRTVAQLAAGSLKVCISPSEPSRTDTVQDQGGWGVSESWCSSWQPLLGRFLWGGIYWLREGAPCGTRVQTSGNFMSGPWIGRGGSRWPTPRGSIPPSLRRERHLRDMLNALKWNLFVEWCSSHREDPQKCPIRVVLSFLQQGLERKLSPSTLKIYVAAIAANHDPVEGKSVGKHDWIIRFLRGARRLNSSCPPPPYPLGTYL